MNRRPRHGHRRTTTALAAVAAAALLLTACGDDADDHSTGPDQSQAQNGDAANDTPDSDTDAEGEDAIDRPEIEVADSLEMVFEKPSDLEPLHEQILFDNEQQIRAVFEVLTTHDTENSSVGFYTTGNALANDLGVLERVIERGRASGGVMKFFARDVTSVDGDIAFAKYCRDFSEVYSIDFATGEVAEEADANAAPTFYEIRLEKNGIGVWQTTDTSAEGASDKCP
ncbi:hypothetical protein [Streptomyces lonarensis]|uniref:Lipoprotein n=1 Tax=Streptomyces lonarensis TaxID=700599 RepID=A0A7X6CZ66_9ACTN|nr:hypothetical protein [Streptomyces lonarensis]NJQ05256.1 hypothetical protein [Streptomyces lonarensis]